THACADVRLPSFPTRRSADLARAAHVAPPGGVCVVLIALCSSRVCPSPIRRRHRNSSIGVRDVTATLSHTFPYDLRGGRCRRRRLRRHGAPGAPLRQRTGRPTSGPMLSAT